MASHGNPTAGGTHHYIGEPRTGGRRSLFDDKIAAAEHMRFSDGKKEEWLKTTTNYRISNAHEMKEFLPWAESFQSHGIIPKHVRALADAGICGDVELGKLSRDLWGYFNL